MLTNKKLVAKRARKEVKRAAKRKALRLALVKSLKGMKMKRQALQIIGANPQLLEQFKKWREQVKLARLARKVAKYGTTDNTVV
jgi:hypothetical protein